MINRKNCGGQIPLTKREGAVYCSDNCRAKACYRRKANKTFTCKPQKTAFIKEIDKEAKTAQAIRALQPVIERYKTTIASPYLGAEYNIY